MGQDLGSTRCRTQRAAAFTREAIDEMGLKQGDQVTAVVKATEVMLMK
jgi:molybdopterin-binding protein